MNDLNSSTETCFWNMAKYANIENAPFLTDGYNPITYENTYSRILMLSNKLHSDVIENMQKTELLSKCD